MFFVVIKVELYRILRLIDHNLLRNDFLLFGDLFEFMHSFSDRAQILLWDCFLMFAVEVLIDWVKHGFITRFNEIPIECYEEYTTILASDLITCKRKYVSNAITQLLVALNFNYMDKV